MKYRIQSTKGYWLPQGSGYTSDKNQAGIFELNDMKSFNLDGCTLHLLQQWELQELDNSKRNSD